MAVVCEEGQRRVLIKLMSSEKCEELVAVSDGKRKFKNRDMTVTVVELSLLGFGVRYVRVHGLPLDVEHAAVVRAFAVYGP